MYNTAVNEDESADVRTVGVTALSILLLLGLRGQTLMFGTSGNRRPEGRLRAEILICG
jgi:hypothetical protein